MKIKGITDTCFSDYKKISLYIAMPYCSFKCDKENGCALCQNSALANEPNIEISIKEIINIYKNNSLVKAIVFGGLEPFDSEEDLHQFIMSFRMESNDTIVIYTGYTEEEINKNFNWIFDYTNIVIKFGRFRPNDQIHFDEVLGVNLASCNQYAKEFNV